MTEEELIDYIDSKIKTNGKRNIVGSVLNTALKAIIGLISGASSVAWGNINGDITDQSDLQSALSGKQNSLGFTPENSANKGNANGYAPLNSSTQIDSSYLPSYVDDVLEYANFASLPGTGANGKIYVTLDNNLTYRWSGSAYVEISASLVLGETSSTAYRGDRGKTAYDHSQATGNPHGTTASDVGAPSGSGTSSGTNTGDETQSSILTKLGFVIFHDHTASATQTGGTDVILKSIPIGDSLFSNDDFLNISCDFVRPIRTGSSQMKMWIGPNDNSLTGATQVALSTSNNSSVGYIPEFKRGFQIKGGNISGMKFDVAGNTPVVTISYSSLVFDNTATKYLMITNTFTVGTDTGNINKVSINNFIL